jgi:hypothetical protein
MISRGLSVFALVLAAASSPSESPQQARSYPIKVDPSEVYEFPRLAIKSQGFELETGPATVVPIACEPGVTGFVVLGSGTFKYAPPGGQPFEGQFRAAMLRFNPKDQPALLPLTNGKTVTDGGAAELSQHVLRGVFRHCWHRGMEALIPPEGSIAAVLYSREHGDVLVSDDGRTAVVHSFTERKTLYERK